MGLYGNKDRELDATIVKNLIDAQFVDLAPVDVTYLKSGMDSDAFLINQQLIFRFPKRADVDKVLNREIVILPSLKHKFNIAIPEFEYLGIPSPLFPYHFVGYHKINGIFAREASLNNQNEKILANDFGSWLSTLHEISIEEFENSASILNKETYDSEALEQDLEINLNRLQSLLTRTQIQSYRKFYQSESLALFSYKGHSTIIHGDLLSEHILLDPETKRLHGVIDWSDIRIGDPATDFAGLFHWKGEEFVKEVLRSYQGNFDLQLLARARILASLIALQDLVWGLEENLPEYIQSGRRALDFVLNFDSSI